MREMKFENRIELQEPDSTTEEENNNPDNENYCLDMPTRKNKNPEKVLDGAKCNLCGSSGELTVLSLPPRSLHREHLVLMVSSSPHKGSFFLCKIFIFHIKNFQVKPNS